MSLTRDHRSSQPCRHIVTIADIVAVGIIVVINIVVVVIVVLTIALRATDCARWLLGYLSEIFHLCYMAQTK